MRNKQLRLRQGSRGQAQNTTLRSLHSPNVSWKKWPIIRGVWSLFLHTDSLTIQAAYTYHNQITPKHQRYIAVKTQIFRMTNNQQQKNQKQILGTAVLKQSTKDAKCYYSRLPVRHCGTQWLVACNPYCTSACRPRRQTPCDTRTSHFQGPQVLRKCFLD